MSGNILKSKQIQCHYNQNFHLQQQSKQIMFAQNIEEKSLNLRLQQMSLVQKYKLKLYILKKVYFEIQIILENNVEIQDAKKQTFKCEECKQIFEYPQSLKRHIKELHSCKQKIYMRPEKLNERYPCTTCDQTFTHSAVLKRHIICLNIIKVIFKQRMKQHINQYQIKESQGIQMKLKRLSNNKKDRNDLNTQISQQIFLLQHCFQQSSYQFLHLEQFKQMNALKNYLIIDNINKIKILIQDEYAYKVFSFYYLIKKKERAQYFANEYVILNLSKQKQNQNLLALDGIIVSDSFLALRLPKLEMNLREYLLERRNSEYLKIIQLEVFKGLRELHQLGYVHRELKPDNIMINLILSQLKLLISIKQQDKKILLKVSLYEHMVSNGITGFQLQQIQKVK